MLYAHVDAEGFIVGVIEGCCASPPAKCGLCGCLATAQKHKCCCAAPEWSEGCGPNCEGIHFSIPKGCTRVEISEPLKGHGPHKLVNGVVEFDKVKTKAFELERLVGFQKELAALAELEAEGVDVADRKAAVEAKKQTCKDLIALC